MRKLISISLFIFTCTVSHADCLGYGTSCLWPSGSTMGKNTTVIINTSELRDESCYSYFYLQSVKTQNKIPLSLTEACKGGLHFRQLVFKPSGPLAEGEEYELHISISKDSTIEFTKWDKAQGKYVRLKWLVMADQDIPAPVWLQQPNLAERKYEMYGCGPEAEAIFSFPGIESAGILVRATVTNKQTGQETVCYDLLSVSGKFALGHGMCSGIFRFDKERGDHAEEYEVKFNLIDKIGNVSLPSVAISFVQPNSTNSK